MNKNMTTARRSRKKLTNVKRSCEFCHTITTPLWRRGPSGLRSLCNACGLKYGRRRYAQQLNLDGVEAEPTCDDSGGAMKGPSSPGSIPSKDEAWSSTVDAKKEKKESIDLEEAATILWAMANGITLS